MSTAFGIGLENTVAWVVLVIAAAFVLGGVWALVDTALTYGSARLVRRTPQAPAPSEQREREWLNVVVSIGGRR